MKASRYYRAILRKRRNHLNRKRLDNHNFSIISSNCVGGVIFHELGERYNSPTVNLYILPGDYLKFLKNLKSYIKNGQLTEDFAESKKMGYPVGILEDIHLYFVHYKSFEEAKKKWYERCKRMNWNNLYIIMVEGDSCTRKMVLEFSRLPYPNKVIFTAPDSRDVPCASYIPGSAKNKEVIDLCLYKNKFTGKRWIDDFDYVRFLNHR